MQGQKLQFDDLDSGLAAVWNLLHVSAVKKNGALGRGFLATGAPDGHPEVRTVMIRGVNGERRTLIFFTDRRSPKALNLTQNNKVSLAFYDHGQRLQIRLSGLATLHTDDRLCEQAWESMPESARSDYASRLAPGSEVASPVKDVLPKPRDNFAVVRIEITRLEWMMLNGENHRRAVYAWNAEGKLEKKSWAVP